MTDKALPLKTQRIAVVVDPDPHGRKPGDWEIVDAEGRYCFHGFEDEVEAQHIVSCVNACAGLTFEEPVNLKNFMVLQAGKIETSKQIVSEFHRVFQLVYSKLTRVCLGADKHINDTQACKLRTELGLAMQAVAGLIDKSDAPPN